MTQYVRILTASVQAVGVLKRGAHPHVQRWMSYIESLPSTQEALAALVEAKSKKVLYFGQDATSCY